MERKNFKNHIQKLNDNSYVLLETGEVKEFNRTVNRAENSSSRSRLASSMKTVRDLINCNCTEVQNCRWMTFTYAENMQDFKRLMRDRETFWKRTKRYLKSKNIPTPEYISIPEPQGRGAWHLHEIWVFPNRAPFLPNEDIRNLWQKGFVTVKKLEDVDNVGAYITAYLCDVPIEEYDGDLNNIFIKTAEIVENGKVLEKKLVKGGRLHLYPAKMNFYRTSRGVKRPIVEWTNKEEAIEKVKDATLTYSKAIRLTSDDETFSNDLRYDYYNTTRKKLQ